MAVSVQTRYPRASVVSLGPIRLASRFLQAALSGYSDWPMRTIARVDLLAVPLLAVVAVRLV